MSNFIVRKVAVLGAGVMGAQIAAHFTNANIPVLLYDLPAKEGDPNGLVTKAIANIGDGAAIFEAVHGSAPDIAGKGIANPLALLLAGCMMLDHVGRNDLATRVRKAVDQTLCDDHVRTGDLGGKATTREITDAIVRRLA